jgi:PhnB protein
MANVKPIPDGYNAVIPYLYIKGAAKAIDFYKNVFGAKEVMRMPGPDGKIGHAEIKIGDSMIMISDEHPQMGALSPQSVGGSPVGLHVYVENVDAVVKKATDGGAKLTRPVKDQFYGDRSGSITDPFGHLWYVSTHVEEVSPEEIAKRAAAMAQTQAAGG